MPPSPSMEFPSLAKLEAGDDLGTRLDDRKFGKKNMENEWLNPLGSGGLEDLHASSLDMDDPGRRLVFGILEVKGSR